MKNKIKELNFDKVITMDDICIKINEIINLTDERTKVRDAQVMNLQLQIKLIQSEIKSMYGYLKKFEWSKFSWKV